MAATKTLKIVMNLPNSKTMTLNLLGPKDDLTSTTVASTVNNIIAKNAFIVDDQHPTSLKEAYIYSTERTELPAGA